MGRVVFQLAQPDLYIIAFCAVLGHAYSHFPGFCGGKALAVFAVTLLAIPLILLIRIICDVRLKGSFLSFIFHPLGVALLLLSVIVGASCRAVGAGVAWKDRVYQDLTRVK